MAEFLEHINPSTGEVEEIEALTLEEIAERHGGNPLVAFTEAESLPVILLTEEERADLFMLANKPPDPNRPKPFKYPH